MPQGLIGNEVDEEIMLEESPRNDIKKPSSMEFTGALSP